MSTPDQWFNRCRFLRRDQTGIDATTHLPTFSEVVVLDNEPCDLFNKNERQATSTPAGTVYVSVVRPYLKIYPSDYSSLPDANDEISVDGGTYRVLDRRDYWDAGSGGYRGSLLTLQAATVDQ